MISTQFMFAQSKSLQGNWILESAQITDVLNANENISAENSFFAFYLDKENKLTINEENFPVSLGGEVVNYTYSLTKRDLILELSNNVYIKRDNEKTESINSSGTTVFHYTLRGNRLKISRTNNTFKENYFFKLAN